MDGDVGSGGTFEEGPGGSGWRKCQRGIPSTYEGKLPEYSRGNIATPADGDHEVWFEILKDLFGGLLAEFVDL